LSFLRLVFLPSEEKKAPALLGVVSILMDEGALLADDDRAGDASWLCANDG
jgi:hypothetical protein